MSDKDENKSSGFAKYWHIAFAGLALFVIKQLSHLRTFKGMSLAYSVLIIFIVFLIYVFINFLIYWLSNRKKNR